MLCTVMLAGMSGTSLARGAQWLVRMHDSEVTTPATHALHTAIQHKCTMAGPPCESNSIARDHLA